MENKFKNRRLNEVKEGKYSIDILSNYDDYSPYNNESSLTQAKKILNRWALTKAEERYHDELKRGETITVQIYDREKNSCVFGYSLQMNAKGIIKKYRL